MSLKKRSYSLASEDCSLAGDRVWSLSCSTCISTPALSPSLISYLRSIFSHSPLLAHRSAPFSPSLPLAPQLIGVGLEGWPGGCRWGDSRRVWRLGGAGAGVSAKEKKGKSSLEEGASEPEKVEEGPRWWFCRDAVCLTASG